MKKLVIVLGSPSAGKTAIVSSLSKDRRYKIINFGTVMYDLAIKKKFVKDRDKMRYLDLDKQTDLRDAAAEQVAKIDGNVVLDMHAVVEQHGRFFPGLPHYMMNHFRHISGLFYIDAETDDILARRKRDKTREREIESKWLIDTQRDINLSILSFYSTDLNIPLYIIDNEEGKLNQSVKTFKTHLEDAFGEK